MYANEMNLVHRGSYEIDGVSEASQTLFGKDLRQLDLAQIATIAALFQNPSYRNPYRHPDRAMERRNLVLDAMVETGAITRSRRSRQGGARWNWRRRVSMRARRRTSWTWCTTNWRSGSATRS
jgi:membrane peptidoglycan carboxypeptidase